MNAANTSCPASWATLTVFSLARLHPKNCVTVLSVYVIISSSILNLPFCSGHPIVESTVTTSSIKLAPKSEAKTVLYGVTNVPDELLVSTSISKIDP